MRRGKSVIDWSKVPNALSKPKRLHLEHDEEDGLFHCPVPECKHDGFSTQRGCRKHVKKKHLWFFYFDEKTDMKCASEANNKNSIAVKQESAEGDDSARNNGVKSMPSFDISGDIAKQLHSWFTGTGGSCKSHHQA
jgi:hypothetical protein